MNKKEFVEAYAEKTGFTKKDSETAINSVFEAITDVLKSGESITLVGFGTFSVKERAAHTGINPSTQEKIKIAKKKVPAFKAGKSLKDAVAAGKKKKK